jgi:streptogramin lyase
MKRAFATSLAVAAILASSCNKAPTPAPEPAPPSASAPASLASAAVTASASAAPPAPSATAEAAPSRFYLAMEVGGEAQVLPGDGKALVIANDFDVVAILGGSPRRITGFTDGIDKFRTDGVARAGQFEGFGGRYPDQVYARIAAFAARGTTDHQIHHWLGGGRWEHVSSSGNDMASVLAVTPYEKGFASAIIHIGGELDIYGDHNLSFDLAPAPAGSDCKQRLRDVNALYGPPGGGLIAQGTDCAGKAVFEVFAGRKSKGVYELPDLERFDFAAASADEIYVAGLPAIPKPKKRPAPSASAAASASAEPAAAASAAPAMEQKPYFAVLSNGVLSPRPLPANDAIDAIDAAADGTLWAASGGAVWRKPRGGAWTKVPLPEGASAKWVVVGSPTDIWAGETRGKQTLLYRTKPLNRPTVAGAVEGTPPKPAPAKGECDSLFVLMYELTSHAGIDYTFPLTREAMKGHTEFAGSTLVVTESWQVGAFVPTAEMGEKLAALIKEKLKGQRPQLVCFKPRIRSEVVFDLATGKLFDGG